MHSIELSAQFQAYGRFSESNHYYYKSLESCESHSISQGIKKHLNKCIQQHMNEC